MCEDIDVIVPLSGYLARYRQSIKSNSPVHPVWQSHACMQYVNRRYLSGVFLLIHPVNNLEKALSYRKSGSGMIKVSSPKSPVAMQHKVVL